MIQIEKVEVRYFRSIYSASIKNAHDLCVISGKNDSGKSNFLKALNLFFNNETDWRTPVDFKKDFSRRRLREVRRDTIKGKQYIQIKVHFFRGPRYQGSLPEKFSVTRTWHRDSVTPTEKNSLRDANIPGESLHRAQASLQRYLNTVRYEYVPAVKDRAFFSYSLGVLQDAVLQTRADENLKESVEALLRSVQEEVDTLKEEFSSVTGVDFSMSLPNEVADLFRAFLVMTGEENDLPLTVRGDGIQTRFLPSLLHHVAVNSKQFYIWGFEEPENCLEHGMATALAERMAQEYSNESQILLTSHSPAFISLEDEDMQLYRVSPGEMGSEIEAVDISDPDSLMDDLGLLALQRRHQQEYQEEMDQLRAAHDLLQDELADHTSPVVLVEGETDVLIFREAWNRLYPDDDIPFRIVSCDVSAGDPSESSAGCGILKKALESCRKDETTTVGVFDYDREGIKAFRLDGNFTVLSEGIKIHTNGNVAAITLPCSESVQLYYDAENLCTEFLFPEHCLQAKRRQRRRSGNREFLRFRQKLIERKVEGALLDSEESTEPQHRTIIDGKMPFAKTAVQTFNDEDFSEFSNVFNRLFEVFDAIGIDLKP
jgi:predicted ATPase